MKINEASVIDNKVIDEMIAECEDSINGILTNGRICDARSRLSVLEHIKSHLKPLEPIVRDAYQQGMIDALTNTQTKTEI